VTDVHALSAEEIARRREAIRERIASAARRRGRDPEAVALMAVTKGHGPGLVANAARAGLTLFGENRVQEGAAKIAAVRSEFPRLEWRLIGPLQTNKARTALQWFSAVESLDRERLVAHLENLLATGGRRLPVLLEVNVGSEDSKHGVAPGEAAGLLEAALAAPHLDVRGLMAVPPYDADPERARPFFSELFRLRASLSERFGCGLPELSMGMSHDFEVAVEEGATEVRVGTALFGTRAAP
jgi:pyridoxal phosphate enzyme (YggS family)